MIYRVEDDSELRGSYMNHASFSIRLALLDADGDGVKDVVSGDFNADHREELALYTGSSIQIWGVDQTGTWTLRETLVATQPTLVAANVDNDSPILRYTGTQELVFTEPRILAVMAAPPAYASKNVEGSTTTFGRVNGTETEESNSFGFSVGFSMGYDQDFEGYSSPSSPSRRAPSRATSSNTI